MISVWIYDRDRCDLNHLKELVRCESWRSSCGVRVFSDGARLSEYAVRHSAEGEIAFFGLRQGSREDLDLAAALVRIVPGIQLVLMVRSRNQLSQLLQIDHSGVLFKPVSRPILRRAFFAALRRRQAYTDRALPVRTKGGTYQIKHCRIYYLEKDLRQIHVHLERECVSCYGTFQEMKRYLTAGFYQCHKSYLVNLDKVIKMERREFLLDNGQRLIISQGRYQDARSYYLDYLHSKT